MKKISVNFPKPTKEKNDNGTEIDRKFREIGKRGKDLEKRCKVLEQQGNELKLIGKQPVVGTEPRKKKKDKARKRWNLLRNMLLAFGLKRHKSLNVSCKLKHCKAIEIISQF